MTPGIYPLHARDYHADPCPAPSLSNGLIKTLLTKSPMHAAYEHPKLGGHARTHDDTTQDKFDYGSAAHDILLEGGHNIHLVAADDWRTKAAKEEREVARQAGKVPMLERHYDKAQARAEIARAFVRQSMLGDLLSDGRPELGVFWQDDGGLWCRARPDFLATDNSVILDYKTTSMANPDAFCRHAMHQFGYDTQSVFYRRGVCRLTGVDAEFVFLVQEDFEPYTCYLVKCAPSMEQVAESKVARAMGIWRKCLAESQWPGYGGMIHHAEATAWAISEEEVAMARDIGGES